MKNLLVAGLLSAIGVFGVTSVAQADSWYCIQSDDERCDIDPEYVPEAPDSTDEYEGERFPPAQRPANRRYRPDPPDWGEYEPPPPPRRWQQTDIRNFCARVGQSLRKYGYRKIRSVDCGGKNFKYTGYKNGERFLIKVKARTGRIIYVIND